MEDIAGWIAPILTTLAALMTAANLGPRFTGWGFVVFAFGSVAWASYGAFTGQANLLWQNAILLAINLLGVWRWLGRQARYSEGAASAEAQSVGAHVPRLFPASALADKPVIDRDGAVIGTALDAMIGCDDGRVTYMVVARGGVGGVGETLHAIPWPAIAMEEDAVRIDTKLVRLQQARGIPADDWPAQAPADWDRPAA